MEAAGAGGENWVARTCTLTRPRSAARRGASAAQLDVARLDAARRAKSPQMPKKQTTGEAAGGPRSKKMSSEKARRVVSNPRLSLKMPAWNHSTTPGSWRF